MAWDYLALVEAAKQGSDTLDQMADQLGYYAPDLVEPDEDELDREKIPHNDKTTIPQNGNSPEPTILPKARFVAVKEICVIQPEEAETPQNIAPLEDPKEEGSLIFDLPTPFLKTNQLWPLLFNTFNKTQKTTRLDTKILTKKIARGEIPRHIPRRKRRRWPLKLTILVDTHQALRPYRCDFAQIVKQLEKKFGQQAIAAWAFKPDFTGQCLPWSISPGNPNLSLDRLEELSLDQRNWQDWQQPSHPILILSDLGCISLINDNAQPLTNWLSWLSETQFTQPVVTLSPAAHSSSCLLKPQGITQLDATLKPIALNDQTPLPRRQKSPKFDLIQMAKQIQQRQSEPRQLEHPATKKKAEPNVFPKEKEILSFLSCLTFADEGLLRKLRIALKWGGSDLEGYLWNHPHVQSDGMGIRIANEHQDYWQKQFAELKTDKTTKETTLEKFAIFIRTVHAHRTNTYQDFKHLENFLFTHHLPEAFNTPELKQQSHASVTFYRELTQAIDKRQSGQSMGTLKALCKTALRFVPEHAYAGENKEEVIKLYEMAYKDEIAQGRWENIPNGIKPSHLTVAPEENPRRFLLQQINATGGCCWVDAGTPSGDSNLDNASRSIPTSARSSTSHTILELAFAKNTPLFFQPNHQAQISLNNQGAFSAWPEAQWQQATLSTPNETLQLHTLTRPSWASAIGRDAQGLYATIRWQGKQYRVNWAPDTLSQRNPKQNETGITQTQTWNWQLPAPFGQDAYGQDGFGLYVDLKIKHITQRFRWIEPGAFLMGSPEDEIGRSGYEDQHPVTLTMGFWLADTLVTQALWQALMGENPSEFKDETNLPVENVSWFDCQDFVERLKATIPSIHFCLPTEAQWEYACRAGSETAFSFGNTVHANLANYRGIWEFESNNWGAEAPKKTMPVKTYQPNPWGLYDMHGNLWEWCQDVFIEYLTEAAKDPLHLPQDQARSKTSNNKSDNHTSDALRVLRGGSWFDGGRDLRSAYRFRSLPVNRYFFIGLRLCLGPELGPSQGEPAPVLEEREGSRASKPKNNRPKEKSLMEKIREEFKKLT